MSPRPSQSDLQAEAEDMLPEADTPEEFSYWLSRGTNSVSRLNLMLWGLAEHDNPPGLFWPIFLDFWPDCDATWEDREWLQAVLEEVNDEERARPYMNEDNGRLYDDLPELITAYRGGARARVYGLSWTLDRAVAERFARGFRGPDVVDPVIATAELPKDAVYAVFSDRKESELLFDPLRLRSLSVDSHRPS